MSSASWDDLPVVDMPHLSSLVGLYQDGVFAEPTQVIQHALLGYYDALKGGIRVEVGDLIYRLSDRFESAERATIAIYPSEGGSLIINGGTWDSLEDWRRRWERARKGQISHIQFMPALTDAMSNRRQAIERTQTPEVER